MNSDYGAMANQYFVSFLLILQRQSQCQNELIIKWAEKTVNNYLNDLLKTEDEDYVVAMDTDSVYITMDKFVKQIFEDTPKEKIIDFLSKAESKIEEALAEGFKDLADYTNAFQQKMEMGREVIADRGIWTVKKKIHSQCTR